jgi:hypothetical protein
MYTITIDEDTLEFSIIKDGHVLPFNECLNIQWALQGALAVINRTESEKRRRDSDDYDPKAETPASKNKRARRDFESS